MSFFLAILCGLGLARLGYEVSVLWCVVSLAATLVAFSKKRAYATLLLCIAGASIGCWRGVAYAHELKEYDHLYGRVVTVQVVATSDGAYDESQIVFDASNVVLVRPYSHKIPGKLTIKGLATPAVYRGDVMEVMGKLYKTRGSKQGGISYASLRLVSRNKSMFDTFRQQFSAGVRNALPEPLASFGLGLLIGQRTELPKTFTDVLSVVGLTHIVAVSGYNLTIIIEFARNRLGKKSKYQALAWSLSLMTGFVLVTGFSASIVRASLVSVIGLWAWYYGRTIRPLLIILFAAATTALCYPLYVWTDVGWYLSFLAFFGVLVLAPNIVAWRARNGHRSTTLSVLIIESFCAQVMTLPIIMYVFHRLSIIGLVSNVLVVPFVPIGMLTTFFGGGIGMIAPVFAGVAGVPARFVLSYMMDCATVLAGWSHASVEHAINGVTMMVLYGCIVVVAFAMWRAIQRSGIITDKETKES